jgi:hypothetical protein
MSKLRKVNLHYCTKCSKFFDKIYDKFVEVDYSLVSSKQMKDCIDQGKTLGTLFNSKDCGCTSKK